MRARRSVWSDAAVQELAQAFVPAADEVHRLQTRDSPECVLFQEIAEQGHYAGRAEPSNTRQGIYAIAPDGGFLASCNSTSRRTVLRMMRQALNRWQQREGPSREAPDLDAVRRPEDSYPRDGLVLRVTSRDLPRDEAPRGWHARAWNLDYAWFTREEARSLLPADPAVGQRHEVPARLVDRIVRLHLVDNVRGQTVYHPRSALRRASLQTEVTAVSGNRVTVRLTGDSLVSSSGSWPVGGFRDREDPAPQDRGLDLQLLGHATYDPETGRFTAFEMVALGTRWGGTQFNSRARDLEPHPIGFAFTLAEGERIAPAFLWRYGW